MYDYTYIYLHILYHMYVHIHYMCFMYLIPDLKNRLLKFRRTKMVIIYKIM